MKAINKFFIALFCFVSAGVCGILGVVLNSVIWEAGLVSVDLERKLNWFSANPETAKTIVIVLWVFAGLMALFGVISLWKILSDKKTTADTELGIEYERLED